jgi:hypothetical protein
MGFELTSRLALENAKKVRDECNKRDVIPTAILATCLPMAVKVIGFTTPSGRETLRRPLPEGKFWAVIRAGTPCVYCSRYGGAAAGTST